MVRVTVLSREGRQCHRWHDNRTLVAGHKSRLRKWQGNIGKLRVMPTTL